MPAYSLTAFQQQRRIAHGNLSELLHQIKTMNRGNEPVFIFNDQNGKRLDIDINGDEITALNAYPELRETPVVKSRGRPKLGVLPKEVTLLPRHWDWLATQPSGASAAIRRLIEQAMKTHNKDDIRRNRHERAYNFLQEIAGDFTDYEASLRALFADDEQGFITCIATWPQDIRMYALQLAFSQDNEKND
ncbi:DUF2239 family protein [Yersinia bercovieri]|uniref:DUF2239 family protein n=1 Tax=Yersinia bercovieri TaxID=634 RepID=UPI0005DA70C3|nr:DUF2239 family protein [Yersinia bercovieri]MCB5300645.1 DUF2239 family protein [Yersinia bercovieri]CFQ33409.1 Uncharacterized protein conserved in bacteria [Yersinia bercovieri]